MDIKRDPNFTPYIYDDMAKKETQHHISLVQKLVETGFLTAAWFVLVSMTYSYLILYFVVLRPRVHVMSVILVD